MWRASSASITATTASSPVIFAFQAAQARQPFAEELLQSSFIGLGILVAQTIEHDPARTFEESRAGQQLGFRRHGPRRSHLVEEQLIDQFLSGLHFESLPRHDVFSRSSAEISMPRHKISSQTTGSI